MSELIQGERKMRVRGWHNGGADKTKPAGYGVRIESERDRDAYFRQEWSSVTVEMDDGSMAMPKLTDAFWKPWNRTRPCAELRSADIGRWLLKEGLSPWPHGAPPVLSLEPIADRAFRLSRSKP